MTVNILFCSELYDLLKWLLKVLKYSVTNY